MAIFTADTIFDLNLISVPPMIHPGITLASGGDVAAVTTFYQQVFDSTAGYCYWASTTETATPTSGETTPNHTNNLVAGEHVVLARITT